MIKLILIFMYIGAFTIGGGLVAIPLIQQEVVDKGLISLVDFYNMVAIAESTPGPIGINIATYVGYEQYGFLGSIIVSVSFILPSFIIVSLLSKILYKYRDSKFVANALMYLKAAIVGLIGYTIYRLVSHLFLEDLRQGIFDYKIFLVLVMVSLIYYYFRKKPWLAIFLGALCGMIVF